MAALLIHRAIGERLTCIFVDNGVMRLDEVRQLPQIPVLGTGKIDYKALRASIQAANRPMEAVSA